MPAARAACGFSPTARMRMPSDERSMSHQTNRVATITITKPRSSNGNCGPSSVGNWALSGVADPSAWFVPGFCSRPGVRIIHSSR